MVWLLTAGPDLINACAPFHLFQLQMRTTRSADIGLLPPSWQVSGIAVFAENVGWQQQIFSFQTTTLGEFPLSFIDAHMMIRTFWFLPQLSRCLEWASGKAGYFNWLDADRDVMLNLGLSPLSSLTEVVAGKLVGISAAPNRASI